jgi:hypothetical protein
MLLQSLASAQHAANMKLYTEHAYVAVSSIYGIRMVPVALLACLNFLFYIYAYDMLHS